jgi:uncharacterized membrane protein YhdT
MRLIDSFATGLIALLACVALALVPLFVAAWSDTRRCAQANRRKWREFACAAMAVLALAACVALVRVFLERIG